MVLQPADAPEQPADRGRVELRGGLVEDDEPRAEAQRPRDLHHLLLFDVQLTGRGGRVDGEVPLVEDRPRVRPHPPPVDEPAPGLPVEVQVLGHRERRDHRGLLVHAGHPAPPRLPVGERWRGLAREPDLAAVRRLQAGEDRDERRLARAVAPDERVRLSRVDGHAHAVERDGCAVPLAHASGLDHRAVGSCRRPVVGTRAGTRISHCFPTARRRQPPRSGCRRPSRRRGSPAEPPVGPRGRWAGR